MKRIVMMLRVVALMVVMMVATVAPAFAARQYPPASQAYNNPSFPVSTCATDPSCLGQDVGAHYFENFPPGQPRGF
jgi:hypothetical protein